MINEDNDNLYLRVIDHPAERILARKVIEEAKSVHVVGELREMTRAMILIRMLALGVSDDVVERDMSEYNAVQAAMDRTYGEQAALTTDDLGLADINDFGPNGDAPGKYDPCPCGSGRKFKFCCWIKNRFRNARKFKHS